MNSGSSIPTIIVISKVTQWFEVTDELTQKRCDGLSKCPVTMAGPGFQEYKDP